jgi:hypothetical protein
VTVLPLPAGQLVPDGMSDRLGTGTPTCIVAAP